MNKHSNNNNNNNNVIVNYYNLFRPKTFDEILHTKYAVNLCIQSISKNIFPSLLIFYGAYGSGKTTLARLYAKAINCIGEIEYIYKPCNECINCLNSDKFIFEFNSSNYTQIDHMRNIIENSYYKPHYGQFKIYILDEIHMLSTKSVNILLKEVEEPLVHIKYICITTNLEFIVDAFISRAVLCRFNILDKSNAIYAANKLLDKAKKLNIPFNIASVREQLLFAIEKNSLLSYRSIVNMMIKLFIIDNEENLEEDYCRDFIVLATDIQISLQIKLEKLQSLIAQFSNIEALIDALFKHFILNVIEYNNKQQLALAEMILQNTKMATYNYNGLIVLVSKIHFYLQD